MSRTVDERVVSMQFDNKHFESNVRTTMSTLDKLKQSLNLTGASKGLESINTAASKCNLSPISRAAETVSVKFSAMQVAATTALANITNSAVNAGKRIVESLTVAPITTGFNEYELKMGSIQTIMASTGESLETVNKYLNELNEYSDQTIYSFQDMTNNIGKFTNAGVKLEDAVLAIKGISNEAAVSGANANEASRAMYNFSQALSTGYVQRIDWKSIELANMATVEFKEQLLESAIAMGTVEKSAEGMYKAVGDDTYYNTSQMFIESLDEQWLTSEVLIKTLKNYASETTDIGKKAKAAATEVKTFSMMMDTLKESAQSGWAQSWEILVGDYNEAKSLFTVLSEKIGGMMSAMSDRRNNFLSNIMDSPWEKIAKKIEEAGINVEDFQNALIETGKSYGKITDEMIEDNGGFVKSLKKGWASTDIVVETLKKFTGGAEETGEKLNELTKYTVKSGDTLTGIAKQYGTTWQKIYEANKKIIGDNPDLIFAGQVYDISAAIDELTDAELKNIGYTDEQVKKLRELQEQAEKTGTPLAELIEDLEKPGGRETLLSSFATLAEKFSKVAIKVKETWTKVFEKFPSGEEIITDLINKFAEFVNGLDDSPETIDKIATSLEGLFRVIELGRILAGGTLTLIFTILKNVLNEFDMNFLTLTTRVSEAIIAIVNWIKKGNLIYDVLYSICKGIIWLASSVVKAVKGWFDEFKNSEYVRTLLIGISDAIKILGSNLGKWFGGLGKIIIDFITALTSIDDISFSKVWDEVKKFGDNLINHCLSLDDMFKSLINLLKRLARAFIGAIGLGEEFDKLTGWISKAKEAYQGWRDGLKGSEDLPRKVAEGIINGLGKALGYVVEIVKSIIQAIVNLIKGTPDEAAEGVSEGAQTIGNNIVRGLIDGLLDGLKFIGQVIVEIGKILIEKFCEVFDINSPSKVFFILGGFIIAGLVAGLKNGFGGLLDAGADIATGLFDTIRDVIMNIFSYLSNLDFGSALSIAGIVSTLLIFNKFANAFEMFGGVAEGLKGVFSGVKGVLKEVENNVKATALEKKSKALLNMAIAIGILVAALFILTKMCSSENVGALLGAVGILALLAGVLVGMAFAIDKLTKISGFKVAAIGTTLLSLGIALLLIAATAKIIGGMDPNEFKQGLIAIAIFGGILFAIVAATQVVPEKGIKGLGKTIKSVGIAMLLMIVVAKIAGSMSEDEMKKAGIAIGAFSLIIVGLLAATRLAGGGKKIQKLGSVIRSVGTAMLLMAVVAKIIAGMTWREMGKAAAGIGFLALIIAGLIWATKLAGNKIKSAASMILAVGTAMLMMAFTAKIIAGMEWDEIGKAVVGLVVLGGIITGLIAATRLAGGKDLKGVGPTLLMASLSIAVLAAAVAILGTLDVTTLLKGVGAVAILGLIMKGLIEATYFAKDCKGTLIVITVAIGILAAAVAALSFIDPAKLYSAVGAMSILMGMFAVMTLASKNATSAIGGLIVMTAAIVVMAGVLYLISGLPIESTIVNALSLSVLILALSASLWILSGVGTLAMSALYGVLLLAAIAVPLLAFVGILAIMQNIQGATANALVLTLLADALTLLLIPLTLIGSLVDPALLGVLALTAMAIPLLAFVGILALMQNIQNAEQNVNALIKLMTTLTVILVVLAIVGPMAMVGVSALSSLTILMVAIGALAVGIGALVEQFPVLETFLDKGIGILEQLAYGLGSVIGHFITGFSEEVMSILPKLGASLSMFMMNAMPFIMGAKMVDEKMMSGVRALAETILILTAVDILEGLTSWLTGGSSLASFGEQLPQLGADLAAFATSLGSFDESTVTTVTCAANAIKAIAEAAETLPNEGGWAAKICGDNSISTFGGYLAELGTNISAFATNLGTFDEAKVNTVTCAANAIKAIADVANELPDEGGWLGAIVGDNSISTFGGYLGELGTNIAAFATNLGTFDEAKVTTVTCAANAIKAIANVANELPNEGGWLGAIVGDNDIATFGAQLGGLGTNLSAFVTNLGTFDEGRVTSVDAAVRALKSISTLADTDLSEAKKHLEGFGDKLGTFATDLCTFCGKLSAAETIDLAISNLNKILGAIKDIASANVDGIKDFGTSLKTIGQDGVDSFVSAFSSNAAINDVKNAASELIKNAVDGIKSKKGDLKDAVTEVVADAAEKAGAKARYLEFKDAGKYLVKGFAAGISDETWRAEAKAKAMAKAAAKAAEDALDINSPSKVFRRIGMSVPEGFAQGIGRLGNLIKSSASGMGDTAINGAEKSILRLTNLLNLDIDSQPTIRPVLDLSDVTAGANMLNSMFGMTPSVGVLSNVNSIGSMMNRNQNGGLDLASEFNGLKKAISENAGDTYIIDGITYDDGSNVSDAVKTLVRATKVGRRR